MKIWHRFNVANPKTYPPENKDLILYIEDKEEDKNKVVVGKFFAIDGSKGKLYFIVADICCYMIEALTLPDAPITIKGWRVIEYYT